MKIIHMIGNAHLDPVWQWTWQEGYSETKATFRSALDRMNEFEDFTFTCASVSAYQWVEECCPVMFEEIRQRVREGRWIVAGGFWVQPDCNLPSGESFARQALLGQRYFWEKFGVTAKTGYNVDSFGHNGMLPQLLKKSGMDNYIFMRPQKQEKELQSNIFNWRSPDGSSVLTFRIPVSYCSNYKTNEELSAHIKGALEECCDSDEIMVFYGVGNHGGGPTIQNIRFIKELQSQSDLGQIYFSGPERFFDAIRNRNVSLPILDDDLQFHAKGCYSAHSKIKKLNRLCETRLISAEKFCVLSNQLCGTAYPADKFRTAWENTLFNQFHDSLGGCCMKDAYEDIENFAGESLAIASKTQNTALQRITWNIDTRFTAGGNAVVVFNPHSWNAEIPVRVNATSLANEMQEAIARMITDEAGTRIPSQDIQSGSIGIYGRPDTLFLADIPALGYRVYKITALEELHYANSLSITERSIENEFLRVMFDSQTGAIQSITDKKNHREILSGPGAVPVVLDETECDTWAHGVTRFDKKDGVFGDAEFTIIESGPIRVTLKVVSRYHKSELTQYFSLYAGSDRLEVTAQADWHEEHKLLKLSFPMNIKKPKAFCEIPYGVIERPTDGSEQPCLQWCALSGESDGHVYTTAILNDCKYSFSAKDSTLDLSVLRSPLFADHGGKRTPESPYIDQGILEFRYAVVLQEGLDFSELARAAQELNANRAYVLESIHKGELPTIYSGIEISKANILLSALKRSEAGTGYILRAYEANGENTAVVLDCKVPQCRIETEFSPYEIKTFFIDQAGKTREVLLTELDP